MDVLVPVLIAIALIVVVGGGIFGLFHRAARTTRGGVEAPGGSQHRGDPPFEGIERGG
jgi:hypothetical protein